MVSEKKILYHGQALFLSVGIPSPLNSRDWSCVGGGGGVGGVLLAACSRTTLCTPLDKGGVYCGAAIL